MSRRFIKTPILDKLSAALRREMQSLTSDELYKLDVECKRTDEFNCPARVKQIADIYREDVRATILNQTGCFLLNDVEVTSHEFWDSLSQEFKNEDGNYSFMEHTRRQINKSKKIVRGTNTYQLIHDRTREVRYE